MRIPYDNAFKQGKQIYDLENGIKKNKKIIDELIEANHRLEEERSLVESKLINKKSTKLQRAQLVARTREIENEKQKNIEAIKYHDGLLHNLISEVEYLRNTNKYNK